VVRVPDRPDPEPVAQKPEEGLVIGEFVGVHGVRGEVRLRPLTEFPERIPRLKELRIRFPNGREASYRLLGARLHQTLYLLRLEGVATRDEAEALRGAAALISLEDAVRLPPGRYYHHQLLGLRVLTPEGEELGRIREVLEGPSNDIYVAGRYLIPATHDAVERLSPEEGVLVVRSREYLEGEEIR